MLLDDISTLIQPGGFYTEDVTGAIDLLVGYEAEAKAIHVDGLPVDALFKAGAVFTIAGHTLAYVLSSDAKADEDGDADLEFEPGLEKAAADGDVVTLAVRNTYLGDLPVDATDIAVEIFDYPGANPLRTSGGVAADQPRVQISVRHPNDEDARKIAYQIRSLLDGVADVTVNGTRYVWIAALQDPFPLTRDQQDRLVMVCNYEVIKERNDS